MKTPPTQLPILPCPECKLQGYEGGARIGNRRATCPTCNSFAQAVMRLTRKRLLEKHADEYKLMRMQVELDLYPQVIEDFTRAMGLDGTADDGEQA